MRIPAIYLFVLLLFFWKRSYLLLVWVVASPFLSNLITIRNDNPFFGSYRIVDYEGYLAGPSKQFVELLDFDRIVLVLLFLAVVNQIRRPTNLLVARVQRWLGIFALAVFISALFSHNVLNALRKAVDTFGLCYLAFIIGRTYLADREAWTQFLNAMLVLGVILGCTCVIEYRKFGEWNLDKYGDAHRVAGPFRYWETLGMLVSIVAFVAWFKWVTAVGPRLRLKQAGYLMLGLLMAHCVFRTQTRTIMLALALGTALLLYRARGAVMSQALVRKLVLALCLGIVFLLLAPELLTSTRFYQNTVSREQTADGRKETYIAAARMFVQNPLIGIGLKNFEPHMKYYMRANEVVLSSLVNTSCHSSYFVIAAECGLMGLIPFLALMASAFVMCNRHASRGVQLADKAWGIAMLGMTVMFFLCGTFFDPFFDPTMQNQLYYLCLGGTAAQMEALAPASIT